jgi:hypothetical protein
MYAGERGRERERERELYFLKFNLRSDIPTNTPALIKQTNPGITREKTAQECGYQEVGLIGGHLGGWLPHRDNN